MTTRITGLYSSLDVDSLVEAGVSYYQNKVDTAKQTEQKLEWKQDQYRSIQTDVQDFYSTYLDPTSSDGLGLASNWNTATYSSSNTAAVTATAANSDADIDTYKVSVTQLASAATTTLSSSDYESTDTLKVNGKTIDLTSIASTLTSSSATAATKGAAVASLINSTLGSSATVTAKYSSLSGGVVLSSSSLGKSASFTVQTTDDASARTITGTNLKATITNSAGTVYEMDDSNNTTTKNTATIDGVTFTFSGTTSSSSTKNITSSSVTSLLGDSITGIDTSNLKSTTTTTGTTSTTSSSGYTDYIVSDSSSTKYRVRIATDGTTSLYEADGTTAVTSAITLSDGTKINTDGTVTATDDNSVTLTGSNDVTDLQDKLESFIGDYNTLIKTINGKIYETYDSDYQPLTDSEKSSMSDTEITKWNTVAKTGLLRHDSYLEELAEDMKSAMSTFMKSSGLDLEAIGIDPVDDYTTKNGTFSIDSDTLKSALEGTLTVGTSTTTFEQIQSLFRTGYSSTTSLSTKTSSTDGILAKLRVALNVNATMTSSELSKRAGIEGTTSETTNEITQLLDEQSDLIDLWETRLSDKEEALYAKYATLETNLSTLESYSSIFSSSS